MMSRHCSGVTTGFLKKLPALPIGPGRAAWRGGSRRSSRRSAAPGCGHAGLAHLAFDVEVAQHRLPGPRQAKTHPGDQRAPGQRMLEHAVAVAEVADARHRASRCGRSPGPPRRATRSGPSAPARRRRCSAPATRPPCRGSAPGSPARAGLEPASRRSPGRARLRRRQPRRSRRRRVPRPAAGPHLDLQHHLRHVSGQDDVAAAAQDELGREAEIRVVDHAAHIGVTRDAHQGVRYRRQSERIARS
jgi:hypothetical protein